MSDIHPQDGGPSAQGDNPLRQEAQAAKDKIGGAVDSLKSEAAHFAGRAKEQVSDRADQGKEVVTTALSDFAEAVRAAGDQLGQKDQTMAARLVSQAAEGLETLSRSVAEKRPEDMLNAVRDFGRNNPTAFVAGAVLAGIALGRFARSSAQHVAPLGDDTTSSTGQALEESPSREADMGSQAGVKWADQTAPSTTPDQVTPPGVEGVHADAQGSALGLTDIASPEAGVAILGDEDQDDNGRAPQTGI